MIRAHRLFGLALAVACLGAHAQALAPGQPPGFFCPVGWQPNPNGSLMRGGGFKCFADTSTTIPKGFECPAGMALQDHSKTGLLICQPR
ncbi:hypothetical protein BH11PSE8_BH11PSE8_37200 [soil metagenome]